MLSLILPARNWPGERIEACVRSFLRLKSKALTEIVIVDFGSDKPIALKIRDKRVRIVRVKAERWSSGEATNIGASVAQNSILAKADADIIVARESGPGLDAAVAALARGEIGFSVVQATDLPNGIDATTALGAESAELAAKGRLRARWGLGGLCLFSAEVWNDIGGVESRYQGWGNEDNDFPERIRRSGRRVRWLDQQAARIFHVWHPPRYVERDIVSARTANQRLYVEDKSTFRATRFLHSKRSSLPAPSVANRPRPLVTVAFASRARTGRERMLGEAIRGFAGQIDNDFEILIADNGSTPEESATLRKSLSRLPRALDVRVIDIEKPSIPAARNRITDEARGRYICVADDDDIPLTGRLADHLACFERDATVHGSHGGWIDFDEQTGVIDFNTGGVRKLETMLFGRGKVTAHPASFYRRDAMRATRYDESIVAGSDLDLAVRMASMGLKVAHTGSYVTLRRFHQSNITITNLFGQVSVGVDSRQRVADTLSPGHEKRLRELGKAEPANVACRNGMTKDGVAALIPGYCGVWRLLVPLSALSRDTRKRPAEQKIAFLPDEAPDRVQTLDKAAPGHPAHNGATLPSSLRSKADLTIRAEELARLVDGDVGVVDSGIDPRLYYISKPIKGAAKVLKARAAVEEQLDVEVEMLPDVEYQQKHTQPFDWSTVPAEARPTMLVSRPIKELDRALAALARVPDNTALRAMTSIVADFNCTKQLYRLVTTPIRTFEGPARVRKILERQTGERFQTLSEADLYQPSGQAS